MRIEFYFLSLLFAFFYINIPSTSKINETHRDRKIKMADNAAANSQQEDDLSLPRGINSFFVSLFFDNII